MCSDTVTRPKKKFEEAAGEYDLYWVETPDHEEDWFVVAKSYAEAESYFEDAEGYDPDEAYADVVCEMTADAMILMNWREGYPAPGVIEACGGVFLPPAERTPEHVLCDCGQRIVRFGDKVFAEGDIVGIVHAGLADKKGMH